MAKKGGLVLGKAQMMLSEEYIKRLGSEEGRYWILDEFGLTTSFGALTFGHALYKGEPSGPTTPDASTKMRVSDSVYKIFWTSCPLNPKFWRGQPRNLRQAFENEVEVLQTAKRNYSKKENPCPNYYNHGTMEVSIEFAGENYTEEIGWIEMERLDRIDKPTNSLVDVVNRLHNIGYTHNDLSSIANVLQRNPSRVLVLIDVEKAEAVNETLVQGDLAAAKRLDGDIGHSSVESVSDTMRQLKMEDYASM